MIYEKETWQSVAKEKKVDSNSAENNFRNFFKLQESSQICDHSQSVDAIDQVGFDCHGDNAKYPFSNSNLSLFQQHNGNFEQHNGNFNKQISYCNGPGSLLCSSSRRHNANLDSFLKMASLPFMTSNTRKVNDFPSWSLPKHRCNHSSVSTSDFETTATNEMSLRSRKGCMMMMEVPFSANANSKNRGKETTPNLSVCNKHCDAFRLQRDQELGEKLFFGDRKQILSRCNAEPLFSDPLLSNGFQNREFGFTETVLSCPIGTKQNIENLSSKSHCIQRNSFSSPPKRKKIFSPRRRKKLTRGSATRRTQRRRRKRVIHSRAKRNSALLAKNLPYRPRITRTKSRVPDNFYTALFTTLFCCFPLGLASLFYAYKVRMYLAVSNRQKAQECSLVGRKLANTGIMLGITAILYILVYFMLKMNIPYASVEYDYYLPEYAIG